MSVPEDTTAKSTPIPSPALVAKKTTNAAVAPRIDYSASDLEEAEKFGRLGENGTVYVTDNGAEREIGQFPDGEGDDALKLYARRFLDLKAKVELFATRLKTTSIKPHEIDASLKSLAKETKMPDVVGDLAGLRARVEELRGTAKEKKADLEKVRKAAVAEALAQRTAIVEKAEALYAGINESTNWRNTADELEALFKSWQEHQQNDARIDKPTADALWERFAQARTAFNEARHQWVAERNSERSSAKKTKQAIVAQAEALKDSTAWGETSRAFNDLMDQWKAAGRSGRREDDALWKKFRAAADTFYDARQADRNKMGVEEKENLTKKEALVVKAEALLPVSTEKQVREARAALGVIQDEWDTIGMVPRDQVRRISGRLNAVEKQIKAVEDAIWKQKNPETDARKSSFETQLTAQLDELNAQIAAETDSTKKKALEAEKVTKQQWLSAVK